jgi:hypothetical protein
MPTAFFLRLGSGYHLLEKLPAKSAAGSTLLVVPVETHFRIIPSQVYSGNRTIRGFAK